jgi:hypothetical protein
VRRCAVLGVQRAFETGGCVTPLLGQTGSAVGSIGLTTTYNGPGLHSYALTPQARAFVLLFASVLQPLARLFFGSFFCLAVQAFRRKQLAKKTEVSNIALSTGQSCT